MGVAKKQDCIICFKTPVSIVKDILAGIQAYFIKILTVITVPFTGLAIYLISLEPLQLYFIIEI
jgi:hypothetical protein